MKEYKCTVNTQSAILQNGKLDTVDGRVMLILIRPSCLELVSKVQMYSLHLDTVWVHVFTNVQNTKWKARYYRRFSNNYKNNLFLSRFYRKIW